MISKRIPVLAAVAAVGILLACGSAVAQVFRVVAFGDSITLGVPFDDQRSDTCNPASLGLDPDFCGYSVRLSEPDYYNCNPDLCFFDNRGRGGESTSAGLTRLDGVLREKDWHLVILMEGTNDISKGVSLETVRFNLEEMARRVEAKGATLAQASIIRFNPSYERAELAALNAAGEELRKAVAAQAAAGGRCFVDARARLCPSGADLSACLASNYWRPPAGEIDPVGHPNSRGFDALAEQFFAVLGAVGPPGAAEPVAPIEEEVCSAQLAIEWKKEQVAESDCGNAFFLEIEGARRTEFAGWFSERQACSGNSCLVAPPVNLSRGDYSYRIQTRNTAGFGPQTNDVSFSVLRNEPDAVTRVLGPRGPLFSSGGVADRFEWEAVKDARSYRIEVISGKGRVVLDESISAGDACVDSTCAFTPPEALPTDRYSWRVQAENACGGVFSQPVIFEIFAGPPASAPLQAGPAARVYDPQPRYRWETVAGATEYEVQTASGAVVTVAATDVCIGGVCRLEAGALAPGAYGWRVRAGNPLGFGTWSELEAFEIVQCACERASTAGGAQVLMAVPEEWNGDLVVWAPASNAFGVRELTELGPLADRQFEAGFALAATSYSVTGWPLFKSKRDLEKVVSTFSSRFGEPERIFLVGQSVGGLAAVSALEKARLDVAGALALCAPFDVDGTWEAALDLRLSYDAVCGDEPGATIGGGPSGLAAGHGLEPRDVEAALNLCTGLSKKGGNRSRAQRARLAELLAVTRIPEDGVVEAMELATFGLFDLVTEKRKLRGGVPVGNRDVLYASAELDATIERVAADRRASRKLERFSKLGGKIGEASVVSLHTSDDPVFFVENQAELAALVPSDQLVSLVAVEDQPTHCEFTAAELAAGWEALLDWVDSGEQPDGRALERRCQNLQRTVGGECRFDSRYDVAPMSTRVAPRP
jgi:lysophospholipase L1-like esterase/pimeloyl-ACP methyl ester carboxylesterase